MKTKQALSSSSSFETSVAKADALRLCPRMKRRLVTSSALFKKLDPYQQNAVGFSLETKFAALFFEQGTGKTWIAGGIIDQLVRTEKEFQALVVVPLTNLETTWWDFFKKQLPQITICICEADFLDAPHPKIWLVNYESAGRVIAKRSLRKIQWTLIVYDEAHRLKDRASGWSRVASKLRNNADYKLILTGTPLEKSPKDAWAQFRFLAPHVFGTRWADFEEEFYEPLEDDTEIDWAKLKRGSMRMQRILRQKIIARSKRKFDEEKLPEFIERIKPYALRVMAKDVLDLPPLTITPVPVPIWGQQRSIYEDIAIDSMSRLGEHVVTAPLKITKVWKLHQVCGGYVIDDDGNTHEVGRAKLRRTLHLVKASTLPVVIFCRYVEEVEALREEISKIVERVEVIYGKNRKQRPEIQRRFQAGKIDVLICQIRSGGIGLDLFRSHVGIVYSMSHSYIDYDQAIKRLHRRGQQRPVEFFVLYVPGTIDEAVFDVVSHKGNVTRRILSRLKPEQVLWRRATRNISMGSRISRKTSGSMRRTSVRNFGREKSPSTRTATTAGTARRITRRSSRS